MMEMKRLVFLLFAFASMGLPAVQATELKKVTFPSGDTARTEITGYLMRPDGAGALPVIVALHGCSGLFSTKSDDLSARHRDWGERFVAAGYAVLFPDSYGSRGLPSSLCKLRNREINPKERANDVRGAVEWLAKQPFVERDKLALIGWSNGGSTVLWSMAPSGKPTGGDFRVAFAFYPGCRVLRDKTNWQPRLPLTILIGAADDWTPAAPCQDLAGVWKSQFMSLKDAYHDFDAPSMPLRVREGMAFSANNDGIVHTGTNEEARARAIKYVMETLSQTFKSKP